jgi:linoleoyl-CoA desaturase
MGLCASGLGFNIGHDALHGAYCANKTLNMLAGHSFSLIGANTHNWVILHNRIHHTYTNVAGADGDLEPIPLLRFYPEAKDYRGYHRFQYLYAPFLYAFTSFVWVFKKDFDHIFKTSHMGYQKPPLPKGEFGRLIGFKSLYFFLFLLAPLIWSDYGVGGVIAGFLAAHAAQGLSLALVFQLGHLVEGPEIAHASSQAGLSWHRVQLHGTCNFASQSRVAAWICGGLNQQIEHHLFPNVSHVHYPALSKIVKATAEKHGVPYHEHPTYLSALRSHFRVLKRCGRAPIKTLEVALTL